MWHWKHMKENQKRTHAFGCVARRMEVRCKLLLLPDGDGSHDVQTGLHGPKQQAVRRQRQTPDHMSGGPIEFSGPWRRA